VNKEASGRSAGQSRKGFGRELIQLAIIFCIAFVVVFGVVRPAVAAPYKIPSPSMEPTLRVHDRLLANKFIYNFSDAEPGRGDIVVFESVENPEEDLVKRVVGLPGDTIALKSGVLRVNGKPKEEPYIHSNPCLAYKPKTCSFGPVQVPGNHVFVMGDNRANSHDSRFFGAVPDKNLIGKPFVRFWPPGRIGTP
jgi:signal peptidase I